ncbi:MAG: acyltransferase family protein, partial [Faecalibacterium prausnitzii]|nr:acyltransferase family protein [Faecalibacterium prausnitzii]
MEEQKRHSGFETMRILSMVMIVLMHGIGHGGLGSAAPQGSAAFWIYWLLFILARVSTNCFVMLSGYYLSERKGAVRAGRLFRIGAQVWFYSMLTFCVAVKAGAVPLSAVKLLRALLPLTSNGYWFASAYFLMYLSVPVLNAVVQSLDRRQYKTLLLVALLLQSVWGTLFYWATDETFVNNGYSFIWFYTLYFMAAYFRKYRVTVPSGLCLLAYLAASAAGLFNRMLALRVE